MPVPPELPPRFTATLRGTVRALLAHGVLDGGRALVQEPAEGEEPLHLRVEADRDDARFQLLAFPPVTDRVATRLGRVSATVTVEGQPVGTYEDREGHVAVEVALTFDPKHLLARTSRVRLRLDSDARLDEPELEVKGDPLDHGDRHVVLVGSGTFEGGSLDGGTLWLAVTCAIEDVEARP